jgi:hypothetical protein
MRPGRYIVLSIFSLISLVFVFSALAGFEIHPCYVFNNMYGTVGTRLDASVSSGCLICHMVESNPYGSDIYVYLRECFETSICDEATIEGAIRNVEPFDSDGDGYDNITEINNLTFPSDPSDYPVYASQWAKSYGGSDFENALSIQQTSDGGYIVAGSTDSFGAGNGDAWVLKLDETGDVLWQKTYGGTNHDYTQSIQQTSDGGYIVAGSTYSFGAGNGDIWVLKLDETGNVLWQKTYGGTNQDYTQSIQQTSDGGYIAAGVTYSFGSGDRDTWVLKLDDTGDVQWQKTYGGTNFDLANSIQQTSDGGYIVAGSTYSFGADGDAWVLKLDDTGDVQWQKTYGGANSDVANSIQQTSDGGYIVAGSTYSFGAGNGDIWVLKLDETGNVLWQKTYGGANYDMAKSIQQTLDGGYIAAGYTESFGAGYDDAWVLKLDETGNVLWQKTYGGTQDEEAKFIQQTSDGGYIVAGWIFSFFNTIYESDFWVLKLDSNGGIPDCSIIGTSNAIVNDVSSAVNDTTVTGIDTNVSPQTSSAVTTDTNATVKDTCSPPTIGYSPTSFSFTATQGGLSPSNQSLNIWNEGGETLSWNVSNNATSWLSLNPTSGTDTRTVILSVNIAGLTAGTYNATITITATDATNLPLSVPVALTINASPTPIIDKILGVKEPGGIIRIIGQNFGETQGNSEVHIGPKFYGPGHSKIKLWTDTKIKVKLPNYKCEWFNGQDFRYRKIWVTVDGIDSNKKKIKVLKPDTCP